MPARDDFADTLTDLLSRALLGPVRAKRMFGGHGFYFDELFIAVLVQGVFYLKTSAETRAAFEAEGLQPWFYLREGRPVSMGFHPVPESALASPRKQKTTSAPAAGPRATTRRKTT